MKFLQKALISLEANCNTGSRYKSLKLLRLDQLIPYLKTLSENTKLIFLSKYLFLQLKQLKLKTGKA